MKHKIPTFFCALLALAACGQSSLETTFASQSTKIDAYVTKQLEAHPEYRVAYNDGVVRLVVSEGDGTELAKGGAVSFYYAGYNFSNSSISAGTMFATNDPDIASAARWNLSDSTKGCGAGRIPTSFSPAGTDSGRNRSARSRPMRPCATTSAWKKYID